jgi:hypothetical protein
LHGVQRASSTLHVQAQNFARLALRNHLERTAANLAIGRELLKARARVYHDFKGLPAERARDVSRHFHTEL